MFVDRDLGNVGFGEVRIIMGRREWEIEIMVLDVKRIEI